MLHTLRFSLQNAIYFIILPFLVPVLFTFYIQVCQNLNVKLRCQKAKALRYKPEGRGFEFPMVSLEFFIDIILPAVLWPWG